MLRQARLSLAGFVSVVRAQACLEAQSQGKSLVLPKLSPSFLLSSCPCRTMEPGPTDAGADARVLTETARAPPNAVKAEKLSVFLGARCLLSLLGASERPCLALPLMSMATGCSRTFRLPEEHRAEDSGAPGCVADLRAGGSQRLRQEHLAEAPGTKAAASAGDLGRVLGEPAAADSLGALRSGGGALPRFPCFPCRQSHECSRRPKGAKQQKVKRKAAAAVIGSRGAAQPPAPRRAAAPCRSARGAARGAFGVFGCGAAGGGSRLA